jgi:RecA-family ATPase
VAGELGIIASPSGIGKTSVLVQIALDKLLQGQKVIHVSFTQHTDYVLAWYEDIFDEFIKKKNLEQIEEVKNELVKNRVLMKFNQEGITGEQILRSLRALIVEGDFKAKSLIVDGFDFSKSGRERIVQIKNLAQEQGFSIWYSCTIKGSGTAAGTNSSSDKRGTPLILRDFEDIVDVIVLMEPKPDHIELSVSKDRDTYNPAHMALRLDPRTLLILEQ